jgi:hypothetical protein
MGSETAGLLIAATNEGWCFLIDGVSYLAVLASLLMMSVRLAAVSRASTSMLEQLREGWTYVSTSVPLRTILLLFALPNAIGAPMTVIANGCAIVVGAALFTTQLKAVRREIKPIYQQLRIMPLAEPVPVESGGS